MTCLARVAVGLVYAGCVQAQTYVTPSGTYGPGSYTNAFQFFGTNGVIQGGTSIYPAPPYPPGAGGAGVSVAGGGSAIINPDLGAQPGNIVIQSDYRQGAPNDALYVANGTLTVVASADPSRITYAMGHGQTVHGIYIPGESGPSIFSGARMYMSADGQDANAIRGYGVYAKATVYDSTLVATGVNGHGIRLWDRAVATLVNTNVTASGTGGFGVFATDNSTIDATGGSFNTTLDSARGVYIDTAVGRLNGTNVNTQGASAYGIQAGASNLSVTGGTISTIGSSAHGLWLYSGTSATLSGAAVGTSGASARGIYVSGAATAVANQTNIGTQGNLATAAYVTGAGASLTMTGGSLTTAGTSAHGAYVADGATFGATDTAVSSAVGVGVWALGTAASFTRGSVSGGLYAAYLQDGATLTANGTTFTAGTGATRGVQSSGSNLVLTDVTVNTSALNNYGVYAYTGGTVRARNLMVNTTGQNGYGVRLVGVTSADLSGLTVRTSGAGAHGAVFEGGTSPYTGSDLDIATTGGGIGVYAWQNSSVNLAGGRIDTGSAANAHGLYIANATMDLTANGAGTGVGVTTGGAGANAAVIGAGGRLNTTNVSLHARGANAAGLYMFGVTDAATASAIASGTVGTAPLAPVNDDGSPGVLAVMAPATPLAEPLGGTEAVTLNGSSVVSDAGAAIRVLGGNATIAASNSVISGLVAFQVQSLADGGASIPGVATLNANASTLTGAALTETGSQSTLNLANGSRWNVTGNSVVTYLGNANSLIDVQAAAGLPLGRLRTLAASPIPGNAYRTVSVTGDYSGNNGTVALNTFLDAGGTLSQQFTDRLLIAGNASGTTAIQVKPVATSPGSVTSPNGIVDAREGISVVQVAGTASPGSFALAGGYVTAANSPIAYRLYAYGPGSEGGPADAGGALVGNATGYWDYRLQSAYVEPDGPVTPSPNEVLPSDARPAVAPQVASYLSAAASFLHAGILDLDNLHRRLGEVRDDRDLARDKGPGEMFFRAYGGNFRYATNLPFQQYGYNATGDYAAIQLGGNLFKEESESGIWRFGVAGSVGWLRFSPIAIDGASRTRSTIYRINGYGTYQSNSGWYVDGIVSGGWFDGDVSTDARGRTSSMNGSVFAASIEGGYPMAMPYGMTLEPQLQLIGQHVGFSNTIDADNLEVNIGSQNQVVGRAGVRVTKPLTVQSGRLTPYFGFDLLHAFSGGANVQVGDMRFESGKLGDAYQLSLGVNGMPTARMSLYGRVSYQHALGSTGVQGWLFNAGVRYLF